MTIFLYGASGSGKSTLGKELAHALNLDFLDLDAQIEIALNESIIKTIEEQGEEVFRDAETAALKNGVKGKEKIVALGGGALLRAENHALAEESG